MSMTEIAPMVAAEIAEAVTRRLAQGPATNVGLEMITGHSLGTIRAVIKLHNLPVLFDGTAWRVVAESKKRPARNPGDPLIPLAVTKGA